MISLLLTGERMKKIILLVLLAGCSPEYMVHETAKELKTKVYNDEAFSREDLKNKVIWIRPVSKKEVLLLPIKNVVEFDKKNPPNGDNFKKNRVLLENPEEFSKEFNRVYPIYMKPELNGNILMLDSLKSETIQKNVGSNLDRTNKIKIDNDSLEFKVPNSELNSEKIDFVLYVSELKISSEAGEFWIGSGAGMLKEMDIKFGIEVKYGLWDIHRNKMISCGYFVDDGSIVHADYPVTDYYSKKFWKKIVSLCRSIQKAPERQKIGYGM